MTKSFIATTAVVLSALLALTACQEEQAAEAPEVVRPVKAIKIGDATVLQQRWFPGRAQAAREVELSFRVSGPLIELPIKVGDRIAEGDVLARIDPATFQAEVDRIAANVNRAQASLQNAKLQLQRQETLYNKGHVAKAALDRYIAAEAQDSAEVRSQQANLQRARLDLGYTTITAPFAGVVVATYVENFEEVREKQRILRLLDPSEIEMVVNIPESMISVAPQVKEVITIFDAFPDVEIVGRIKEIGAEASETTRTYPVTLVMDQPEGIEILPGMAGRTTSKTVIGPVGNGREVEVPLSATFSGADDASMVWVIDEGTMQVVRRPVAIGSLTNQGIMVTDGLSPGEWVVTAGVNSLKEGQKVRILEN